MKEKQVEINKPFPTLKHGLIALVIALALSSIPVIIHYDKRVNYSEEKMKLDSIKDTSKNEKDFFIYKRYGIKLQRRPMASSRYN